MIVLHFDGTSIVHQKQTNSEVAILASVRNKLPANIFSMANDKQLDHTNVTLDGSVQLD